ncbi:hypothetical protein BJX63DRAFT_420420 [Aspergillus granulosus]|uniref:ATP-dependent protease n=1 Tax=Aspergillus granulosus TaxID=176169 RepID=A0ABR4HKR4_9EURO
MEPEDVTSSSPHSPTQGDDAYSISYSTSSSSSSSRSPTPSSSNDTTIPAPHEVIRLIQCSRCSRPFRTPLRLPCGNTLCRSCLPPVRPRTGVSYPASGDRRQGFTCYWGREDCGADHCLGDCGVDVTLSRLIDVFQEVLGSRLDGVVGDAEATIAWKESSSAEAETENAHIGMDMLRGVYDLTRSGRFGYGASGIRYDPPLQATRGQYDRAFEALKAAVRNELDCQMCYSLILDPLTTPCGHTFCRGCVAMALSHSNLCPICRQKLNMTTSVQSEQTNKRLSDLIQLFDPETVASRRADLGSDIAAGTEGKIPLFVTSLSFPTMPMALHIFEPRYRLMIQRVMESRSRKFGMVMPNRRGRLQQGLGRAPFLRYGTVLVVDRYELLPDGRSLVIATGMSRFRVVSWELVDGYHVGKIQRVDDVSISEEEAQESREVSAALDTSSLMTNSAESSLDTMSTQQLFQFALDFVLKERRQGAPWLHPRVLLAYGALPTDPALFPWWLATVIPIWDEEKYALLSSTTVRQRLKVTARWIKRLESRPCPFSMSVSISFGPGGAITHFGDPGLVTSEGAETYLSQTLVLGLFLAIFATQVAINAVQAVRTRRRARVEGTPAPAPTPTKCQNKLSPPDTITISTTEYRRLLKESLLSGGLSQQTLDVTRTVFTQNANSDLSSELDEDEDTMTDPRSDDRDGYGDSSRSTESSSPRVENRTVLIRGLPDRTTHQDIVDAVKGGAILHIYLWARDRTASVSFVEEIAAQNFLDHTRTYGFYVAEKKVEVLWNDRQFYLPPFVRAKIINGATRNLVIYNANPNITERLIKKDLEHIHNLIVISVKFKNGNAYIQTNSVHNALFARSCMMSRLTYKGMKIAFSPDDCAEPFTKIPTGPKGETPAPVKKPSPLPNRFHLLFVEESDEESEDPCDSLDGGVCWTNNSVSA